MSTEVEKRRKKKETAKTQIYEGNKRGGGGRGVMGGGGGQNTAATVSCPRLRYLVPEDKITRGQDTAVDKINCYTGTCAATPVYSVWWHNYYFSKVCLPALMS